MHWDFNDLNALSFSALNDFKLKLKSKEELIVTSLDFLRKN